MTARARPFRRRRGGSGTNPRKRSAGHSAAARAVRQGRSRFRSSRPRDGQRSSASIAAARAAPSVSTGWKDVGRRRLLDDGSCQPIGIGGVGVTHCVAGAVALQPVPDMEVLLEVMLERYIDEWGSGCGEFHARAQSALHHGDVTGRQVLIEVGQEAAHPDAASSG